MLVESIGYLLSSDDDPQFVMGRASVSKERRQRRESRMVVDFETKNFQRFNCVRQRRSCAPENARQPLGRFDSFRWSKMLATRRGQNDYAWLKSEMLNRAAVTVACTWPGPWARTAGRALPTPSGAPGKPSGEGQPKGRSGTSYRGCFQPWVIPIEGLF